MVIEKLSLINFKNYDQEVFIFSPKINLITGENGAGKTNLLDALYILSLTKSAFNTSDTHLIKDKREYYSIAGNILLEEKSYRLVCSFQTGGKKSLLNNKKEYDRISEHIGKFPAVLITPFDTDMIREGSDTRRKFFDAILCQLDQQYLHDLLKYNHFHKQRNALLKSCSHFHEVDQNLIQLYNEQLVKYGFKIYEARTAFCKQFIPSFRKYYEFLSDCKEAVDIGYVSQLENRDYLSLLEATLPKDFILQRTSTGVHKDEFNFRINGQTLKNFGSQGQQKTFSIALKLTQYEILKQTKGFKPILLLDDIFDKLDDQRIEKLLLLVAEQQFGQIFITDASIHRQDKYFSKVLQDLTIFNIVNGKIIHEPS